METIFGQVHNLKFEHIGIREGLSNSKVRGIIQDRHGFMWFGTQDGLNKYDGYKFTVYKNIPNDSTSLSHNGLREIMEDRQGNIWVATWGGGVNVFNPATEHFTQYKHDKDNPHSLSDDFVYAIFEDHQGGIWIGTDKGGLNLFDSANDTFIHFKADRNDPNSLGDNQVRDIFEDSKRNLWIATSYGGLNLYDRQKKTFKKFIHDPSDPKSIASNSIRAVIEDAKGNLWVGTYGEGLDLFIRDREEFLHSKHDPLNANSLAHNAVQYLAEDGEGNIWVGTENGGLSIYNPAANVFANYAHDDIDRGSISDNSIYAIFKDMQGNMWVGTYNDAINLVNKDAKFIHYRRTSSPYSLSNNLVVCIFEEVDGNLLVGTDGGGLNRFDKKTGKFTHFRHKDGDLNTICGDHVLSAMEDSKGNIWVGTWGQGVTMFNPETNIYKHFKHDEADPTTITSNNVWKIYEDSEQNIWIGTYGGGLNLYEPRKGTFTHLGADPDDPESISVNTIYTIKEDSRGYLWVGTDGGGLNRLDKNTGKFKRYLHDPLKNSLSHNRVVGIHEDRDGDLWIATSQGLSCFDPEKENFVVYEEKDGLPSDAILGILEDVEGNLWMSTNKGVSKFNKATKEFKNFTTADGLQSGDQSPAHCKSRSGAMYFGGKGGFNEFYPEKIKASAFDPPLVFTGFEIFNKQVPISSPLSANAILTQPISQTKEIALSYKHSVFSIRFASLNYVNAEGRQYAYMLEGFDNDWNGISATHYATYTNLDPGEYTFKVKALNGNGIWSVNTAELKITITPPYWKTWWFRGLGIFFVTGFALGLYSYRFNRIKAQKKELEKQVEERTSELKAQGRVLEELYTDVKDSIRAAQVIQNSILPSSMLVKKHLPESFIFNKPKDVVSGDFYWLDEKDGQIIIAAADCTGHGVSGAFMSINGYHLLNKAVYSNHHLSASTILDHLNEDIIEDLKSEEHLNGMDIGLCIINREAMIMQYAGALSPLYIVRDGEIIQVKGDPFTIGFVLKGKVRKFTNHYIEIRKGDMIYMFSDGYADQLGGTDTNTKFSYKRFRELLVTVSNECPDKQLGYLDSRISEWMGDRGQLDDILVIGFRIV